VKIKVNGQEREIDAAPDMPLLWALRDIIGLTGTKFGCGVAQCGACTVWMNGRPLRSCAMPLQAVGDSEITTIEGIGSVAAREAQAVQREWAALDVPQCGYCQSGQVMSAVALLRINPKPNDRDIDLAMNGNICRCATYVRIRKAIKTASDSLASGTAGGAA
jgi:isoquinoline 1-oxidoreductase alpha subunit